MMTEEQKRKHREAVRKYDDANTTRVYIKLNNNTDPDIIDYLSKIPNKQKFIKDLIRERISRGS